MSTEVKYLHSSMTGAPTLSGQAGTLIAVLDACLVNGFGLGTVDSVVIAGGVATVTRASGHPFEVDSIALIAGGSVSGGGSINGEKRVLSVTGVSYTFDATGISDQTATGTITHKTAPLGWAKQYSNTNLAAYKSSDVSATGCLLRVDDTGTNNARVVGYETMSTIDLGLSPFPTPAQVSGGGFWGKSNSADSTTRPWVLVGDKRGFLLCVNWTSGASYGSYWFGDVLSNKTSDTFGCVLSAKTVSATGDTPGAATADLCYADMLTEAPMWAARSFTGLGSSKPLLKTAMSPVGYAHTYRSGTTGTSSAFMNYPNPVDNGLYLVQMMLGEINPNAYRGLIPGFYFCPQQISNVFANKDKVTNVTGMSGRTFLAVNNSVGAQFLDITGPWR